MTLKERVQKLKADIPAIFLSLKDRNTPIPAKLFGAITVAYALSPVDFVPDFVCWLHQKFQTVSQMNICFTNKTH